MLDNGDGTATVAGVAGAVPAGSTVHLANATSGAPAVSVTAASDVSFHSTLAAVSGDRINMTVSGESVGTAVTVGDTFPFILDVSRLDDTTQRIQ